MPTPNHTAAFANFNAMTGAKITFDAMLIARYRAPLTRIAENEFRAQHDIKPGMTLRDAGYLGDIIQVGWYVYYWMLAERRFRNALVED